VLGSTTDFSASVTAVSLNAMSQSAQESEERAV
jgi:hypothetical protein